MATEPQGRRDRETQQPAGEHTFVDRSQIDFDPDDGLYSGTAVEGTSEIPGPHVDQGTGELSDQEQNS